ncbi:hypothetical protein N0V90_005794 [Kalmusia sp. IMI 367209]|nr:hypothetical protein N0V90_005794 [Kalmusia sp. IMI 367209]
MAAIFANSSLTIAGPSSVSSQEGFLKDREAGIRFVQLGNPPINLYMRKRVREFEEEIRRAPLNRRGWVFQESQLSRRILYYCVDKMIWRCRHEWAREDSDSGFDLAFTPEINTIYHGWKEIAKVKRGAKVDNSMVSQRKRSRDTKSSLIAQSNWYHLVDEFSRKRLTYESDKLPAISAIAQEVRRLTHDSTDGDESYIAGIWWSDLIDGLLWQRALGVCSDIYMSQYTDFMALYTILQLGGL